MTVWKPNDCVSYRYDFQWRGDRYTGSTDLTTREDAVAFEAELRRKLRRRRAGLEPAGPEDTPGFSEWAKVTFEYAKTRKKLKRPEQFATNLHMILGFWGGRPTKRAPVDGGVYKDLRLGDPIHSPELLEDFEQWMDARGLSGARKNHYRSACSMMYRVALLPANRKRSQVASNPFEHIPRDKVRKRITTFDSPTALRRVVALAAWHIRIALAIGALAPKLRLRNVLALRWDQHVAKDLSVLTDPDHKTDRATDLPLVTHVSAELRKVLEIALRHRHGPYVVHWHGKHVDDIKTGLKRAVKGAGLTWGRAAGVTYHTLRHTMATELVRMGTPDRIGDRVMGWLDPTTGLTYRHLVPHDEVAPLEAIGAKFPFADLVHPPVGKTVGLRSDRMRNTRQKSASAEFRRATREKVELGRNLEGATRQKRPFS